ncbi:MAG: hydroxyacid dehydrogenase [Pseudomonadota bacterium]
MRDGGAALPRLTILGAIHADAMALLQARPDVEVNVVAEALAPRDRIAEAIAGTNAIVVRTAKLDAELLASAPDLKIVSRHGVGCDSVDVAWMSAQGLPVAITVGGNDRSVAEHALGMMLGLAKDFERQTDFTRRSDWSVRETHRGFDLEGRVLLILGHGRIGSRTAELALAFGMEVLAYDPYVDTYPPGVTRVTDLGQGLGRADIVSIHVPKYAETTPLVGAAQVAAMKPGAILINCARGGIADEVAVAGALRSGHLGGYGCDVYAEEPAGRDNPILSAPNTILTPHSAAMTPQGMRRMGMISAQNALDCLDGRLNPDMIFNRKELGL